MKYLKKVQEKLVCASEEEDQKIGEALVALLNLKVDKSNGRVHTSWGDKTLTGLALSVKRIIEEKGDQSKWH